MPILIKTSPPVLFAIQITEIAKKHGATLPSLCINSPLVGNIEISYLISIAPDNFESIDTFKIPKKAVFNAEYSLLIQSIANKEIASYINSIAIKNSIEKTSVHIIDKEVILKSENPKDIILIFEMLISFLMNINNL